jgi:MoaA/NifB/PqqE/SkfB family radical SAM enzyme
MLTTYIKKLFTKESPDKQNPRIKQITALQLEVTNCCNLKCSICCRDLRESSMELRSLSYGDFEGIFNKILSRFNISEFNPQGLGEPFLCADILKILTLVKSKQITAWLVTNGTLINDSIASGLVEIGVDKIRISVDSADPGLYAKIKPDSKLEDVIGNISRLNFHKKRLKKDYPRLAFNSVVLRSTLGGLADLIGLAAGLGVGEVTLIPLVLFSKGMSVEDEQVDFYGDDFKRRFEDLKKIAQNKGVELNLGISMETKEVKYCHHGIYVDVAGGVSPCCNISSFKFGNAYRDDMQRIAGKYSDFRKWLDKQRNITCKECNGILDKS